MAATDKKNFCISGKEFTLVRGARWYLEYYDHERGIPERKRSYGGLNRIKNIKSRESAALTLAASIVCPAGGCILSQALDGSKPLQRLKTWQSQKARLKYYVEWLGRRSPAIEEKEAQAFINFLVLKGLKSATVGSYRNTLSSIYKKAGLTNPWRAVSVPSVVSRSLMYFTPFQAMGLLGALREKNNQLALAAQMLFYCFVRPGEMRLLTVDCINLVQGTISIPAAISKNKRAGTVVIPDGFLAEIQALNLDSVPGDYYLFGNQGIPGLSPLERITLTDIIQPY